MTRVTFGRVVRSEWIKLRSLRSTLLAAGCAALAMVGIGALLAADTASDWTTMPATERAAVDGTDVALAGFYLAQLAAGVLGVLAVTGEYASGTIRATLAAVPRRAPVLWAKVGVLAALAAPVALVASLAAFLLAQALLADHLTFGLGDPGAARAVVGCAVALAAIAVLGAAMGFLVRSTAAALGILVGVLVIPTVVVVAPEVTAYLPGRALQALVLARPTPEAQLLSPEAGAAVAAAWIALALAGAALVLARRDA